MSNVDPDPQEIECTAGGGASTVEVIAAREVPLGGPRAMTVRRTLPTHERSMIGAWCFADHYGPDDVSATGGMNVPPHPHTGLQTVSWLFEGEIEHRDSAGVHAPVLPGELNLMSAGFGISHSEVSTPATQRLHGVQLWLALPDRVRDAHNGFQHYAPPTVVLPDVRVEGPGGTVKVFIGELAGSAAEVSTATPLLGAELVLAPGARVALAVNPDFEHGVLLDTERLLFDGVALTRGDLGYVGTGLGGIRVHNPTDEPARAVLLGGTPFGEDIVMWWNFVGRSHEDIARYREEWQARDARFGSVDGWRDDQYLPAPPLPTTRLKPRKRSPQ
ncbi:Pirin domain protein OS=Tsukamurella paurometabola (strain ATCC 8368 / DSM / CCUG 35730 / CIP 100753 / JCM 10117 / KCTC 9821 / NBRC 16120 / NCIMB 702349/ NCTC 13040) OX=521096 GN=Tpau_3633 PE=3 SV=1 [Tsukamurella paurometabola]|uniref:Pirin domain protein n=1 Tax=Tsukamurella paurometabola (strain ATCC 8368 / DSM 20162 / CCUG 35730 / CIP 100753 / JCM 10117 / KCTC 9821 / NBRC 16120 / NCIMB 702349 / NCTC 13040) TaxID=521096 RepID=D5UXX4_TSUPD|nr:pirin family protein [Tsukamurella paurometabola]ADG80211.1 Pirin domain protein [Tsukamurella paurometabola DSM 20162]SUP38854.1 Quercetin 2,3-dioxygenase [Tsukamurella paurometabola]